MHKHLLPLICVCIWLGFSTPVFADQEKYFVEKNGIVKTDLVRIILDCKDDFANNQPLFKKCFAVKFLDARKQLNTTKRSAAKECAAGIEQQQCVRAKVVARLITTAPAATVATTREKTKCPMATYRYADTECLYVSVPENRSDPRSKQIEIAVMVVKPHDYDAKQASQAPLFYLHGGPGIGVLGDNQFFTLQDWLLDQRELILFDQRGTGYSKPNLNCYAEGLSTNLFFELSEVKESLKACYKRWSKEYDLTAYTTKESAADVEAIRTALGYDKIDLMGQSYGTKLATEVARRYPGSVRSVILDGVVTENHNPSQDYFQKAVDSFFQNCENYERCHQKYPGLKDRYLRLLQQFKEAPLTVSGENPYTHEVREVHFDDDIIFHFLYESLRGPDHYQFAHLMTLLENQKGGANSWLSEWAAEGRSTKTDDMLGIAHYAVRCIEDVPFWNKEAMTEDIRTTVEAPLQQYLLNVTDTYFDVCSAWTVPKPAGAPDKQTPVAIPTLVFSGGVDFLTPPEELGDLSKTYSDSTHIIYPDSSHGTIFSELCSKGIILGFLDDPSAEIDTHCVEDQIDRYKNRIRNYFE